MARIDGTVFIFDLKNLKTFPNPIKNLLTDPAIIKVGHGFKCDLLALERTFADVEDFQFDGIADTFVLNQSQRLVNRCNYKNLKFKTICEAEFGIVMPEFDFSFGQFWAKECRRFSPDMVAYSARDAIGCVDIGVLYYLQVKIKTILIYC